MVLDARSRIYITEVTAHLSCRSGVSSSRKISCSKSPPGDLKAADAFPNAGELVVHVPLVVSGAPKISELFYVFNLVLIHKYTRAGLVVSCQHILCLFGTDGADQMLKVLSIFREGSDVICKVEVRWTVVFGPGNTLILGCQPQDPVYGNSKQERREDAPMSYRS